MEKFQKSVGYEAYKYEVETAFGKIPLRIKVVSEQDAYKMNVELNIPTFIDPVWTFSMIMGCEGNFKSELAKECRIEELFDINQNIIKLNLNIFLINMAWMDDVLLDEIISISTFRHFSFNTQIKKACEECLELMKELDIR